VSGRQERLDAGSRCVAGFFYIKSSSISLKSCPVNLLWGEGGGCYANVLQERSMRRGWEEGEGGGGGRG
jgi:hypothetical protein